LVLLVLERNKKKKFLKLFMRWWVWLIIVFVLVFGFFVIVGLLGGDGELTQEEVEEALLLEAIGEESLINKSPPRFEWRSCERVGLKTNVVLIFAKRKYSFSFSDTCLSGRGNEYAVNYVCEGNRPSASAEKCAFGCEKAMCLESNKFDWDEIRANDVAQTNDDWRSPKRLPFSNEGWEEAQYISPDGNTFYFGYIDVDVFRVLGIGGEKDDEIVKIGPLRDTKKSCILGSLGAFNCGEYPRFDLFFSERNGDGWTEPKPHPLTMKGPPSYGITLVNNNKAYYYTSFDLVNYEGEDIAYSEKVDGVWSDPVNVEVVNTIYRENDPYVTADESEMFFWSDRPAKFGGNNIWRSVRVNGEWQAPEILPAPINGEDNDMQTFLYGNTLYFSSNSRSPGGTPFILYKSERLGDMEWGEPEVVISSGFAIGEPSITDDGSRLYFEQIFTDGKGNFNPDSYYVERK
jgi:hypothetical protein